MSGAERSFPDTAPWHIHEEIVTHPLYLRLRNHKECVALVPVPALVPAEGLRRGRETLASQGPAQ